MVAVFQLMKIENYILSTVNIYDHIYLSKIKKMKGKTKEKKKHLVNMWENNSRKKVCVCVCGEGILVNACQTKGAEAEKQPNNQFPSPWKREIQSSH